VSGFLSGIDPLVAERERGIARLRKPVAHAYELVLGAGEAAP
jgi:hypothetical protein